MVELDRRAFPEYLTTAGVTIPYAPQVITPNIRDAIEAHRFEAEEASELHRIVEAEDRVLEIGAGIGFISTLLDRLDDVDRVVAVEAKSSQSEWRHQSRAPKCGPDKYQCR